jgi:hypothetical protein
MVSLMFLYWLSFSLQNFISLRTNKSAIYYIWLITHLLIVRENFRRIKICVSIMPSVFYAVVVLASIEDHPYMTKHSRF